MNMTVGDSYERDFSYSQEQVNAFAELSGDKNPIHLDADYAAQTPFKKPVVHGMLGASIFSNMLGTEWPGQGTVLLSKQLDFKRPMYPGEVYTARITITDMHPTRHIATCSTVLLHKQDQKPVLRGVIRIMHKEKIGATNQ